MTADSVAAAALLHAAAATGLAAAAWGASRLWRNPHVARTLWLAVLVKLLLPPVWWVPLGPAAPPAAVRGDEPSPAGTPHPERQRAGRTPAPAAGTSVNRPPQMPPTDPRLSFGATPAADRPRPSAPEVQVEADAARPGAAVSPIAWWLAAWAAGAAVVWAAGGIRAVRFAGAVRRLPAADGRLTRLLAEAAGRAGAPAPDLRVCRRAGPLLFAGPVPRLCGRPAVVVPGPLFDTLGDAAARSLLAHEVAHLARGDHRVRWLELLACGAWWWLPTVWLAAAAGRRAEEACCDAAAVRALAGPDGAAPDPAPYAAALLAAAEFLSRPPAGGSVPVPRTASPAGPRAFHRRFTMLLSTPPPRRPGRSARLALLSVCAAALLAGVTVGQEDPPTDPAPAAPAADGPAAPTAAEDGRTRSTPGAIPPVASDEPLNEGVPDELTDPGESATGDEPGDATADGSIRLEPGVKQEITFAVDGTVTLLLPEGRTVDSFFEPAKFLDVDLRGPDGAVVLRSRAFGRDTFTVFDHTEQSYSVAVTVPPPAGPRTLEELTEVANGMADPEARAKVVTAAEVAAAVVAAAASGGNPAAARSRDRIADGDTFPPGAAVREELRVDVFDRRTAEVERRVVLSVPTADGTETIASDWEEVVRRPATAREIAAAGRDADRADHMNADGPGTAEPGTAEPGRPSLTVALRDLNGTLAEKGAEPLTIADVANRIWRESREPGFPRHLAAFVAWAEDPHGDLGAEVKIVGGQPGGGRAVTVRLFHPNGTSLSQAWGRDAPEPAEPAAPVPVPLDRLVADFNAGHALDPPLTVAELRGAARVRAEIVETVDRPEVTPGAAAEAIAAGGPVDPDVRIAAAGSTVFVRTAGAKRATEFVVRDGDLTMATWWRIQKTLLARLDDPATGWPTRLELLRHLARKGLVPRSAALDLFGRLAVVDGALAGGEAPPDFGSGELGQIVGLLDEFEAVAPDAAAARRLAGLAALRDRGTNGNHVRSILERTAAGTAGLRVVLEAARGLPESAVGRDVLLPLASAVRSASPDDEATAELLLEAAESVDPVLRAAATAALTND